MHNEADRDDAGKRSLTPIARMCNAAYMHLVVRALPSPTVEKTREQSLRSHPANTTMSRDIAIEKSTLLHICLCILLYHAYSCSDKPKSEFLFFDISIF